MRCKVAPPIFRRAPPRGLRCCQIPVAGGAPLFKQQWDRASELAVPGSHRMHARSSIPDLSRCLVSSPFQGNGIEAGSRLTKGVGIRHFNSGSVYSTIRAGEESEARRLTGPVLVASRPICEINFCRTWFEGADCNKDSTAIFGHARHVTSAVCLIPRLASLILRIVCVASPLRALKLRVFTDLAMSPHTAVSKSPVAKCQRLFPQQFPASRGETRVNSPKIHYCRQGGFVPQTCPA